MIFPPRAFAAKVWFMCYVDTSMKDLVSNSEAMVELIIAGLQVVSKDLPEEGIDYAVVYFMAHPVTQERLIAVGIPDLSGKGNRKVSETRVYDANGNMTESGYGSVHRKTWKICAAEETYRRSLPKESRKLSPSFLSKRPKSPFMILKWPWQTNTA